MSKPRGPVKRLRERQGGLWGENSLPLVTERYDSVKFVEIVAALARSENGREFIKNTAALRYKDGKVKFSKKKLFYRCRLDTQ